MYIGFNEDFSGVEVYVGITLNPEVVYFDPSVLSQVLWEPRQRPIDRTEGRGEPSGRSLSPLLLERLCTETGG